MSDKTLEQMFDECDEDYLDFAAFENPPSKRADLAAFILLDRLQPGAGDIITSAEHDEFYLSIDCEELVKVITLDDVRNLRRCGVMYSADYECLSLFT